MRISRVNGELRLQVVMYPATGQEGDIEATLSSLNVFINNNVPVIIGEYGPTLRDQLTGEALENHLKSRNDYIEYVVKTCVKNKLVPLYWDAGYTEKLFDRTTGQPHNCQRKTVPMYKCTFSKKVFIHCTLFKWLIFNLILS